MKTNILLSTVGDEYIVTCSSCSETTWLHKVLVGLFDAQIDVTDIFCDNQIYIKMVYNLVFHDNMKHIEVRYHYIWDMVQKGDVKLKYVPTKEQVADVFTNPLSHVNFDYFQYKLGVVRKDIPRKRE